MKIYLISGISGYIGKQLAEAVYKDADLIIGTTRNEDRTSSLLINIDIMKKISLVTCDFAKRGAFEAIDEAVNKAKGNDCELYVLHCASETISKRMIESSVEVLDGIIKGTQCMLEIARKYAARSFVYLSSMEVYGRVDDIGRTRVETELGDINLSSLRSCYPLGKKISEHYCHIYCSQYGVPTKIARLAQTFGKGVNPSDNRVFMQFARAARDHEDIILRTAGKSLGNYVAVDDAVRGILLILDEGEAGECYNIVNEANTMTIFEMANLVKDEIASGSISVRVELEDSRNTGYAPDTGLRMSGEKIRKLGWQPTKSLKDMYEDLMGEI